MLQLFVDSDQMDVDVSQATHITGHLLIQVNPLDVFSETFFLSKRFPTGLTDMLEGVEIPVVNVPG